MATITKIACPNCRAKLKFDADKVTSAVVKFKCPSCKAVIKIRKPESDLATPPNQTANNPDPSEDTPIQNRKSETLVHSDKRLSQEPAVKENATAYDSPAKKAAGESIEESVISEKAAEKTQGSGLPQHENRKTPTLPEEIPGAEADPAETLLEDFKLDKLAQLEEGEPSAEDYEWTRYTDNKKPKIPESTIDLDLVPVTDSVLQETLADLRQAETYNLQGEANLGKNLLKQALRDFKNALEINPDYVEALVNRGSVYVLQNRYEEALSDLNHALELEKKQTEIYNLRGEIYLLNKLYDEAIKDFTAAIILNPTYSDAYLNRARAYSEKGMKEEAESDYYQAVRAEPDKFDKFIDPEGLESLIAEDESSSLEKAAVHIEQGREHLKTENHYEAIECFTQAINLLPNTPER